MLLKNLFIAGMAKCGTTALADWMVTNKLAEDRVPGEKEPMVYALDRPHPGIFRRAEDLPLLDASVTYAQNPYAIDRLPGIDTHIVLCLKNQFQRTWSHYKMMKLSRDKTSSEYFSSYFGNGSPHRTWRKSPKFAIQKAWERSHIAYFPRRSHPVVSEYFYKELDFIHTHTFQERAEYEIQFYMSRHTFPFLSILSASLYYFPLRSLLEKFLPEDITVLSIHKLQDDDLRRQFVQQVFHEEKETPPIPFVFSSRDLDIGEEKPDFNDPAFNTLRAIFRYDLEQARPLIAQTRFGTQLLDEAELDRHLHIETNPVTSPPPPQVTN